MSTRFSRRRFLQATGASAAALAAFDVFGADALPASVRPASANEKLNVAFIGVTGKGTDNLNNVTKAGGDSVNVVALCDVDEGHLDEASKRFPNAKRHVDFR